MRGTIFVCVASSLFIRILPILFVLLPIRIITARTSPDASSVLLQVHRLYLQEPPHDRYLYDQLNVSPNATAAAIRKSYRELSRKYHPDKFRSAVGQSYSTLPLEQIRHAYDILKDDRSRLHYHRYGLLDIRQAVVLLTGHYGGGTTGSTSDASLQALLCLMGYPLATTAAATTAPTAITKDERIWFLATNLVERLRPYVEGRIHEQILADAVAEECDVLKRLPLGASIIRCVGRAYRYEGQRFLRTYLQQNKPKLAMDISEHMRLHLRSVKQLATAIVASGRCLVAEQYSNMKQKKVRSRTTQNKAITYQYDEIGQLIDDEPLPSQEDFVQKEKSKARKVLIESLQIEALWKVSKIEIDAIVREACKLILKGDCFFFSHPYYDPGQQHHAAWQQQQHDGWVGSAGIAIDSNLGRIRAAQALTLIGDVMVSRSKEDTAWME